MDDFWLGFVEIPDTPCGLYTLSIHLGLCFGVKCRSIQSIHTYIECLGMRCLKTKHNVYSFFFEVHSCSFLSWGS